MQKEGILMSINSREKTVKFFSYGAYRTSRDNGVFYDWSEYLRKYDPFTSIQIMEMIMLVRMR